MSDRKKLKRFLNPIQELDEEDLLSDSESDSEEPEWDPNANLYLKKDQV